MDTGHRQVDESRRRWIFGAAVATGAVVMHSEKSGAAGEDGVTRYNEAIHQEVLFKASVKRVYEALTSTEQFQKVMTLSAAKDGLDLAANPAVISKEAGGTFSLFGGYISGRQIELVLNERIVQAWRAGGWGSEHLAAGWKANYWEPLEKFLA